MKGLIMINRGSDLTFGFNWPNGAGGNADLTGFTVAATHAHALLVPNLTLTITNAATGRIEGRIDWDDAYGAGRDMEFYIGITQGNTTTALPKMILRVL